MESLENPKPHSNFPPDGLMQHLIDCYFKRMNVAIPPLHKPTFEKGIADGLHKRNTTFGAVVLLVCAIGSRYSNDPRVQLPEPDLFSDVDGRPSDTSDANPEADEDMRRRRRSSLAAYSRGWHYFSQAWEFQESLSFFAPPTLHDLYFYCVSGCCCFSPSSN